MDALAVCCTTGVAVARGALDVLDPLEALGAVVATVTAVVGECPIQPTSTAMLSTNATAAANVKKINKYRMDRSAVSFPADVVSTLSLYPLSTRANSNHPFADLNRSL